jgi:hypothetical protein
MPAPEVVPFKQSFVWRRRADRAIVVPRRSTYARGILFKKPKSHSGGRAMKLGAWLPLAIAAWPQLAAAQETRPTLSADELAGRALFVQHCGICQVRMQVTTGGQYGPVLSRASLGGQEDAMREFRDTTTQRSIQTGIRGAGAHRAASCRYERRSPRYSGVGRSRGAQETPYNARKVSGHVGDDAAR